MNRHRTLIWFALSITTAAFVTTAFAQSSAQYPTPEVPKTEPEYIAKAKTAAPESIVNGATIVMTQEKGEPKTLQTGSNGFTCLVTPDGTPACADANGMEWMQAIGAKKAPPDKTGFVYMMAGDTGTSNHDPYATDKSHWVQTGPHVMIVGTAAAEMASIYPSDLDPDPTQAYVMFPGTPYAHLMIPVHSGEHAAK
jgi:hypothetical protein